MAAALREPMRRVEQQQSTLEDVFAQLVSEGRTQPQGEPA
jgi:hypothetical protein